ncbi:hypothetical protein BDV28DRAFT_107140 [Aspergillus coremiiformis]|uniref:LDB19 N-terminal domain-containing protein n=1 Tax=Aspergillus coremiiformis TaxID=138285 RepID=A0A5N6Z716_9EURO|nr:hypothetical protein BDV28DRAFT_107140 [Aspergillus coremiiformis]
MQQFSLMNGTHLIHNGYQCAKGIVEAGHLHLDVASTHPIILLSRSETYSPKLPASVLVPILPGMDQGEYPDVSLSLIQEITAGSRESIKIGDKKVCFPRRLWLAPTSSNATCKIGGCSEVETVVDCRSTDLPVILENHQHLLFQFSLAIPHSLPGTMKTTCGEISYTMRATATWPSGISTTTMRPINLIRRVVSGPSHRISHLRNYHGDRLSTKLCLAPQVSPDCSTKLVHPASLVACRTITPGDRPMEVKYVAIKELKWWVEETVRLMKISTAVDSNEDITTCVKQCVREICYGRQKGRWIASKAILPTQPDVEDRDGPIEIPFDIAIPQSAKSVDSLDLSSYTASTVSMAPTHSSHRHRCPSGKKRVIVVSDHLKLDIITGEDTYDRETGSLLDRKHFWKSFKAFYPLSLHEVTVGDDLPEGLLQANPALPQYEDGSAMAPDYDILS